LEAFVTAAQGEEAMVISGRDALIALDLAQALFVTKTGEITG
jgi:hypothetical protein